MSKRVFLNELHDDDYLLKITNIESGISNKNIPYIMVYFDAVPVNGPEPVKAMQYFDMSEDFGYMLFNKLASATGVRALEALSKLEKAKYIGKIIGATISNHRARFNKLQK